MAMLSDLHIDAGQRVSLIECWASRPFKIDLAIQMIGSERVSNIAQFLRS
jgi:hypothetical protein